MGRIRLNAAECDRCRDYIESKHRTDFVCCRCGEIYVDGGHTYLKRGWRDKNSFIDKSEVENSKNIFPHILYMTKVDAAKYQVWIYESIPNEPFFVHLSPTEKLKVAAKLRFEQYAQSRHTQVNQFMIGIKPLFLTAKESFNVKIPTTAFLFIDSADKINPKIIERVAEQNIVKDISPITVYC